jgi:hypothetical protein
VAPKAHGTQSGPPEALFRPYFVAVFQTVCNPSVEGAERRHADIGDDFFKRAADPSAPVPFHSRDRQAAIPSRTVQFGPYYSGNHGD